MLRTFSQTVVRAISWLPHYLYAETQRHAWVGRAVHVLFGAVPDIAFALLALAGLAYLLPEPVRRLEHRRGTRIFLICFFSLFGLFAIVINAVNREEQDHRNSVDEDKIQTTLTTIQKVEDALVSPSAAKMSEAERRQHITSSLRAEYILTHDPIDPDILAGTKMPPEQWMNERLRQLGEGWSIGPHIEATNNAPQVRTYLSFNGQLRFTGSSTPNVEGGEMKEGDPLAFNVHYIAKGSHPVTLIRAWSQAFLGPDYSAQTQRDVVRTFLAKAKQMWEQHPQDKATLSPDQDRFNTAFLITGPDQVGSVLSSGLNQLRAGTQIVFVVAEIDYVDGGKIHHLRECQWLHPPATPNGIWQGCDLFNISD